MKKRMQNQKRGSAEPKPPAAAAAGAPSEALIKHLRMVLSQIEGRPVSREEILQLRQRSLVRDRAMLELLYSTGIRASELTGLDTGDVDLGNATALVTGKGNKQRVVPIGRTALRHLESYLKGVRPFLVRQPGVRALWLNHHGQRLHYAVLRRRLHQHAGRLDLPVTVTPHTFRRSCTTELIRGGANLWHVKELLGHERLDTLQHYAKLTIADLKKTHARSHPREKDEACGPALAR